MIVCLSRPGHRFDAAEVQVDCHGNHVTRTGRFSRDQWNMPERVLLSPPVKVPRVGHPMPYWSTVGPDPGFLSRP
jgi:hypothetical protein